MNVKHYAFSIVASTSLLAGISLLAAVVAAWSGQARKLSTASDLIAEYPVPFSDGNPLNLALDGEAIWFSMPDANAIGRLVVTSTVDFQFTQFDSAP